ncbi:caspase-8-like [Sinocyclocheilus rhinocerous]|uniref:caspase-8-like n=1 Tax=Sinocyclocheilus rhinocerous TaxID=307959 RepID=UPI0007B7BD59|nr:PREDICTED: caspase-8-like [Sinocyclocheilus rhinocerous]
MDLEFQRVLLKVQESLTGDEVQDLVFLCSDLLSLKDLSTVSSAGQLFSLLEKRNQLSCEDPSLLLELLRIMKRNSLIRNLTSDDYKQTNGTTYSQQISPYRQLLYELSESICEQDLKNIKFLLLKTLSRKKLEKDTTLLQLFLDMEKEDLLGEHNLDVLQKIIADINPSLEKRIIQYKTERYEPGGMVIAQEIGKITPASPSALTLLSPVGIMEEQVDRLSLTEGPALISGDQCQNLDSNSVIENKSLNLSVTSQNTEIQQYEMKGDRRGFCLIINNYDFSACTLGNREGTDIDKVLLRNHTKLKEVQGGGEVSSLWKHWLSQKSLGIDLLSILTQVNSDVSKKTDKSGLRKQMPQPEFTLTKRVVFPPPKTHRPLP